MKIGIFDSGIGGLTVFRQLMKKLPNNDYVYLGGEFHPDIKMVHFTHSTNKPHDWEDYASFV